MSSVSCVYPTLCSSCPGAGSYIPCFLPSHFPLSQPDFIAWFLKQLFQHLKSELRCLGSLEGTQLFQEDGKQIVWRAVGCAHPMANTYLLPSDSSLSTAIGYPASRMKSGMSLILRILSIRPGRSHPVRDWWVLVLVPPFMDEEIENKGKELTVQPRPFSFQVLCSCYYTF